MDTLASYKPMHRLLDAVLFFTEQEAEYKVKNPLLKNGDPDTLAHVKKQYENIIAAFRKTRNLTPEEKQTLRFLRHEVRRLRARLNPTVLNSVVHFRPINWALNTLLRRQQNFSTHKKLLATHGDRAAVEYNTEQLHQSLLKAGFTGSVEGPLKRLMAHQLPEFTLRYVQPDSPNTDFLLHFKKIPGTDVYYFQQFDAMARPDLHSVLNNDPKSPRVSVSIHDPVQFSARETANLVNGRPLQSPGDNHLWFVRDATSPTGISQRYFATETALNNWPIKELNNGVSKKALLTSLSKGETRDITFLLPNKQEQKLKVAVSSDARNLLFFNTEGKLIDASRLLTYDSSTQKLLQQSQQLKNQINDPEAKKQTARLRA